MTTEYLEKIDKYRKINKCFILGLNKLSLEEEPRKWYKHLTSTYKREIKIFEVYDRC